MSFTSPNARQRNRASIVLNVNIVRANKRETKNKVITNILIKTASYSERYGGNYLLIIPAGYRSEGLNIRLEYIITWGSPVNTNAFRNEN